MVDAGRVLTRRFGTWCVAVLCWSGVGGGTVLAGELAYGAGYSLSHDSNITRVSTDPVADWTQTLIGGVAYQEQTIDVNARFLAQVESRNFVHNSLRDDNGAYLEGVGAWTISPRQFVWTVEDAYRETLLNLSAVDTPANRAKTNSLNTGPDFTFQLNPTNIPVIGARYGRFDIEGPGDNERYIAYTRWLYQVSAPTTLSLNYEVMRANFDSTAPVPRVRRESRFARYDMRSPVDSTTIDLGTTRLIQYGGEEIDGRLARLTTARRLTSESTLRVFLADQISDTYSDMLVGLGGLTGSTAGGVLLPISGTTVATGDSYHSQRGDLTYASESGLSRYALQGYTGTVDYVHLNQDYKEKGGQLTWTWLYSGDTRLFANAGYVRRTFLSFEQTDVERNSGIGVSYMLTQKVTVVAEGSRLERETTAPTGNFVNRRAMLLLAYSTGPLYTVRSRR